MNVKEYRELYEGLTQKDDTFRKELERLGGVFDSEQTFSELQRAQNRLNYAMLGIHPIYRREVELSGIVNYTDQSLSLYHEDGETVHKFADLDPSYVAFLENQKRIYNTEKKNTDKMPLSSVALKASNEMLKDEMVVPDLSETHMNLPQASLCGSRQVLQQAFARSMVQMNMLREQIDKGGLDKIYGNNKDKLLKHVNSNSFDFSFNRSIGELDEIAQESQNKYGLEDV